MNKDYTHTLFFAMIPHMWLIHTLVTEAEVFYTFNTEILLCTEKINLTGNLIIINYPKHPFLYHV